MENPQTNIRDPEELGTGDSAGQVESDSTSGTVTSDRSSPNSGTHSLPDSDPEQPASMRSALTAPVPDSDGRPLPAWIAELSSVFPETEVESILSTDQSSAIAVLTLASELRTVLIANGESYSLRLLRRTDSEDETWTRFIFRARVANLIPDRQIELWRKLLDARRRAMRSAVERVEEIRRGPRHRVRDLVRNTMIHLRLD
jgi:hypothetical protein